MTLPLVYMASHLIQVEDSHFNVRALLCVALLCSWNKTKSSSQAIERLVPRFGVHSRSGVMWRLLTQFSGWGISTWMRRLSTWFTAHLRWDFSPRYTSWNASRHSAGTMSTEAWWHSSTFKWEASNQMTYRTDQMEFFHEQNEKTSPQFTSFE